MDYSVFRRKKPAKKAEAAPPPPPAAAPEPMPRREDFGRMGAQQFMSGGWGGGDFIDMDWLTRRINNIDIANAQRVHIRFRDYNEHDCPSYYDARQPFCAPRYGHHEHSNYGYGHWPAALPPPRSAGYMLPPPPPPSQRYYGGYEPQYAVPHPAAYPAYYY